MGTRGRKSAASLAVVSNTTVVQRPEPLPDLSDEQAEEWVKIVERMPADWFQAETFPLLAQYCRHIVTGRRVSQMIEHHEADDTLDVEMLDRLYKMQEREGRAMSSLATRMRITQQTTYDKSKKKPVQSNKPWE